MGSGNGGGGSAPNSLFFCGLSRGPNLLFCSDSGYRHGFRHLGALRFAAWGFKVRNSRLFPTQRARYHLPFYKMGVSENYGYLSLGPYMKDPTI